MSLDDRIKKPITVNSRNMYELKARYKEAMNTRIEVLFRIVFFTFSVFSKSVRWGSISEDPIRLRIREAIKAQQ